MGKDIKVQREKREKRKKENDNKKIKGRGANVCLTKEGERKTGHGERTKKQRRKRLTRAQGKEKKRTSV